MAGLNSLSHNKEKTKDTMNQEKNLSAFGKNLREVITSIVGALIQYQQDLRIGVVEMQSSTTITVQPHADDYGKIAGTGGVMFNAIKTIVGIVGAKNGVKVRFVLEKSVVGEIGPRPQFQPAENWSNEPIRALAEKILKSIFVKSIAVSAVDAGETTTLQIVPSAGDRMLEHWALIEGSMSVLIHAIGKAQGRNEVFFDLAEPALKE